MLNEKSVGFHVQVPPFRIFQVFVNEVSGLTIEKSGTSKLKKIGNWHMLTGVISGIGG
jgi:hypothetical protein